MSSRTPGVWALDLSALIYPFSAFVFWLGASRFMTQRKLWARYGFFIVFSLVVFFMNLQWHDCFANVTCYAFQGTFSSSDDINEMTPLVFDTLAALGEAIGFLTLWFSYNTSKYNGMILGLAIGSILVCQAYVPRFTSGTIGLLVYSLILYVAFLVLTLHFALKTIWFFGVWFSISICWGLACYMKYMENNDYIPYHVSWHVSGGVGEFVGVLGWIGLAIEGLIGRDEDEGVYGYNEYNGYSELPPPPPLEDHLKIE
jgi:hypothetical protein